MDTIHLHLKAISRGRTSVAAAAAYRSGQRLHGLDGRAFDYRRRQAGVAHTEIISAGRAIVAPSAAERTAHWRTWASAERRKDSIEAYEIEVSLPHELDDDGRLELVRSFAAGLVKDFGGAAVDFAIHRPPLGGDPRNHHAHILFTSRRASATGEPGAKHPQFQSPAAMSAAVKQLRAGWAAYVNSALILAGRDNGRWVTHESHRTRGLTVPPGRHLGVHLTQQRRRRQRMLSGLSQRIRRHQLDRRRPTLLERAREVLASRRLRAQAEVQRLAARIRNAATPTISAERMALATRQEAKPVPQPRRETAEQIWASLPRDDAPTAPRKAPTAKQRPSGSPATSQPGSTVPGLAQRLLRVIGWAGDDEAGRQQPRPARPASPPPATVAPRDEGPPSAPAPATDVHAELQRLLSLRLGSAEAGREPPERRAIAAHMQWRHRLRQAGESEQSIDTYELAAALPATGLRALELRDRPYAEVLGKRRKELQRLMRLAVGPDDALKQLHFALRARRPDIEQKATAWLAAEVRRGGGGGAGGQSKPRSRGIGE